MTELETLRSLRSMRKRIWVPTDHVSGYQEIKGGAVPFWYIEQRIAELEVKESLNLRQLLDKGSPLC